MPLIGGVVAYLTRTDLDGLYSSVTDIWLWLKLDLVVDNKKSTWLLQVEWGRFFWAQLK